MTHRIEVAFGTMLALFDITWARLTGREARDDGD